MKTRRKAQEPPTGGKRKIDMRLLDLYTACLKNARELLEESELLIAHEHHARAYFLAYTAIEELGKSQVVADYFYDIVTKSEFEAAFRDHKFKAAYLNRYVQIPNDLKDEWFIEYDAKSSPGHMEARNRSLYIECLPEHVPQFPAHAISLESANELISTGTKYLAEIIRMEHLTERIGTKAFTK